MSGRIQALGNAKQARERYLTLARAAGLAGDLIEAENLYQHAEHYFRILRELSVEELSERAQGA